MAILRVRGAGCLFSRAEESNELSTVKAHAEETPSAASLQNAATATTKAALEVALDEGESMRVQECAVAYAAALVSHLENAGRTSLPPAGTYTEPEAIFKALEATTTAIAPVKLLRASWVIARAAKLKAAAPAERAGLALPRRQQLEAEEPSAFLSLTELKALPREHNPENPSKQGKLALGCASYCWLTPEHPDPTGEQLIALADAIVALQSGERAFPREAGIFIDFASLCQKDEHGERTPDEKAAFGVALGGMQLWYASSLATTFMLRSLPPGWEALTGYDGRGWPTCESLWAALIKMNASGHGAVQYSDPIVDVGAPQGAYRRPPPLSPQAMASRVALRRFTSAKADLPMVIRLNTITMLSAFADVRELRYRGLGWDAADVTRLAEVLPLCRQLTWLGLAQNQMGDDGAAAIAHALTCMKAPLHTLMLPNNGIGDAGAIALAEAFGTTTMPLVKVDLARNGGIGEAAQHRLRDAAAAVPSLTQVLF